MYFVIASFFSIILCIAIEYLFLLIHFFKSIINFIYLKCKNPIPKILKKKQRQKKLTIDRPKLKISTNNKYKKRVTFTRKIIHLIQ